MIQQEDLTGCDTTGRFALRHVVIQQEDLHSLTGYDTTGRFDRL